MKGLGVVLIILGILGFALGGRVFSRDDTVAEIGPLEIEAEKQERIPVMPITSGVAVVAGIVLVAVASRRRV